MSVHSQYLLAIETTGHLCGIALMDLNAHKPVLEHVIYQPNMHDAMLAEMVRRAMNDLTISAEQIQSIAVSAGPGSFTGIRIGMSFAKGWCADGSTNLISVPTFQGMANAFIQHHSSKENMNSLCIAMKSHGEMWYCQTFDIHTAKETMNVSVMTMNDLQSIITDESIVIGDYAFHHGHDIPEMFMHSHPQFIAKLGSHMHKQGMFSSVAIADSHYHAEFTPTMKESNT